MQIIGLKTPILEKNFDLEKIIDEAFVNSNLKLQEKNILIIASKIIALAQGRLRMIEDEEDFRELVEKEADFVSPYNNWLTLKDGIFTPNAGIDKSNVPDGYCVLWPEDSYAFADKLCKKLKKKFNLKDFGIVICDSQVTPLRRGVTGISLGYAGFEGVEDLRGEKDLYGKELKVTTRNIADSLSSAALLVMGESNESTPMGLVKDVKIKFTDEKINKNASKMPIKKDLFRQVLKLD